MVKGRIKWRKDKFLRKVRITCDRNGDMKSNVSPIDSRRPSRESQKIKYPIYATVNSACNHQ
jgi:hypothetical protein